MLNTPKETILIIDDDVTIRSLLSKVLSQAEYRVITCENAEEALKVCEEEEHIDIMLVDFQMEPLNGLETVKAIKKTHNYPFVLLTVLTSLDKSTIKEAGELGVIGYITKPFLIDSLLIQLYFALVRAKHIDSLETKVTRMESVNRATGLLAERFKIPIIEANNFLRIFARKKRTKMSNIAAELIKGFESRIIEDSEWVNLISEHSDISNTSKKHTKNTT